MAPRAEPSRTGSWSASAATGVTVRPRRLARARPKHGLGEIGAEHRARKPRLAGQQRGDVERAGTEVEIQAVRVPQPRRARGSRAGARRDQCSG